MSKIKVKRKVIIVDNISNSSIEVLDGITNITNIKPIFEKIDLREKQKVEELFQKYNDISGVIHFAASKAVGESVENPLLYYENNIHSLVYLLQQMQKKEDSFFIFSSSCTVYGQAEKMPITEGFPTQIAMSPYGNTKQIAEEILSEGAADLILFARESLRRPYFALHAARELGTDVAWPLQYERAKI